jgi:hypothetical protein
MVGLLGYMAAGAARGVGKSIVAEAQAKRERQREAIRRQFQLSRDQANREFQLARDQQNFQQRKDLLQDRQAFQREQGDLEYARSNRRVGSTFTNDQGEVVGVRGDGSTVTLGKAQQDPKNPKLYEVYDAETGRPTKVAWDGEQFVRVGGVAARDADGSNVGKSLSDDRLRQWAMEQARADYQAGFMDIPDGATPEQAIRQRASQLEERARRGLAGPDTRSAGGGGGNQGNDRGTAAASEGPGVGSRMMSLPRLTDPFGVFGGGAASQSMQGNGQSQGGARPQSGSSGSQSSGQSRPQSGSSGDAMTPKSQRKPKGGTSGTAQSAPMQAPANVDAVKEMPIEDVRRYVEGASAEEIENLPMDVRSAIVKKLRGGN